MDSRPAHSLILFGRLPGDVRFTPFSELPPGAFLRDADPTSELGRSDIAATGTTAQRRKPLLGLHTPMTDVEIEYCVPCGHLPRALDVQEDILEEFGLQLDGVRLKTGDGGVFKVSADGEVLYDKSEDGDLDRDALLESIGARTSATA